MVKCIPTVLIGGMFLYISTVSNIDLSKYSYALFMDELITFDGVFNIIHSENILDFFKNVLHGNDHRYGRSVWNVMAIFSFLPEIFFSEQGQIIAGRVVQVLFLVSSFLILVTTFVNNWLCRTISTLR